MSDFTAGESDYFRIRPDLQADPIGTPPQVSGLRVKRRRTISNLADLHDELMGKNLLVLGLVVLPFQSLIAKMNVNIRRIHLVEDLMVEFALENHYVEGVERDSTPFSKRAFAGAWDFAIASKSSKCDSIDDAAMVVLRQAKVLVCIDEVLLLTAPIKL